MPTYWVKSGTGGTDAGTSWANAAESVAGLMTAQAIAGGDIIYVHNTHSVSAGAAITWTLPESGTGLVQVLCVDGGDATGASLVDGTVGNLTTGAVESTNADAAFLIQTANGINCGLFVHGITFKAGSGGVQTAADINFSTAAQHALTFSACTFEIISTSISALYTFGSTSNGARHVFENCTFKFGATGQYFAQNLTTAKFVNCRLDTAGSAPTALFQPSSNRMFNIECSSCDWSHATNVVSCATSGIGRFFASNCAIGTPVTGTHSGLAGARYEFQACAPADGTNGANILNYYCEDFAGVIEEDTAIYLTTGGAQGEQDDGTDTPYSLVMKPTANASKAYPLYSPWVYALVGSTGDKTVTMKACDAGTDADELHTSEIWMEVEYMGEPGATGTQRVANSPHSQLEVDDDCNIQTNTIYRDVSAAGTDRTDTDEAWTGITETNTYTFTASVNCAEVGYIRCRIGLAFDRDVYVDPKVNVA